MRPVGMVNRDRRLRVRTAAVARCLRALDAHGGYPVPPGPVEVAFVGEEECARLHGEFFGDPSVTDVMTFPGAPGDGHAGDVAVCPAAAAAAGKGRNRAFTEELTLYLVHAWLHLSGMDDRDRSGRAAMRAAEAVLMRHLGARGALLDCAWDG